MSLSLQGSLPVYYCTITTLCSIAMIQTLIPLCLLAVEDSLLAEVTALACPLYARDYQLLEVFRCGTQSGSIFLSDQKLLISLPLFRYLLAQHEVPLTTYTQFQAPLSHDIWLFRLVLGCLSCL